MSNSTSFIDALRELYTKEKDLPAFESEEPVYARIIENFTHLARYKVIEPIGLGSTAIVWKVENESLSQKRAMKMARPNRSKLANIIQIVRAERERLASLNHNNIIKVYDSDELVIDEATIIPYFIMEYLGEEVDDLDKYLIKNAKDITPDEIITAFRDICAGLDYLHKNKIIHFDIKPGNILCTKNRPVLIADLGYAKNIPRRRSGLTDVIYTLGFEHPKLREKIINSSDSNAINARIEREDLNEGEGELYDLFSFGRTMQTVLAVLEDDERKRKQTNRPPILTDYQWSFLGYIAKRLLDGVIERTQEDSAFENDSIPGISPSVMKQLAYRSAEEALYDFEKLRSSYNLEGELQELNPNIRTYIQIPGCRVPLTPRVQKIIDHPAFVRLRKITQLGFVSLVYPGAAHNRFEHVIGTYANCIEYLRALWYDESNGLFQCIMKKRDLELVLLGALLHDIGQFPMAHDLAETSSEFSHENFTTSVFFWEPRRGDPSLADIVASEWEIEPEIVLELIQDSWTEDFRLRVLRSIISGPLDCDKLDYLGRDSSHLGLTLAHSIDKDRLVRNLTLVYRETTTNESEGRTSRQQKESFEASIGVSEKALVVANTLWRARKDMFSQVYWQHTTRALKAMLGVAVRRILISFDTDADRAKFKKEFNSFVLKCAYSLPSGENENLTDDEEDPVGIGGYGDIGEVNEGYQLTASDDDLILFLKNWGGEAERHVLEMLRKREVFKRLAVLSYSFHGAKNPVAQALYHRFRQYRIDGNLKAQEEFRKNFEKGIKGKVAARLAGRESIVVNQRTIEDIQKTLEEIDPMILLDVPVKALSFDSSKDQLLYIEEKYGKGSAKTIEALRSPEVAMTEITQEAFDLDVGKIRVLIHPDWADILALCEIQISDITEALGQAAP